jgi:hypothetical protein
MLGDVEVEDAPAMLGQHDQDEAHAQARGGNGEEIDRDQVPDVFGQECAPGLRRRGAPFGDQPGDGALADVVRSSPWILEAPQAKSRIVDLSRGEAFGFLGFDFQRARSLRGR